VPIISLQNRPKDEETLHAIAKQIGDACENIGFLVITDHGVDQSTIDTAWKATRDFFDQSTKYKLRYKTVDEAEYPYGYSPMMGESLASGLEKEQRGEVDSSVHTSTADLKEMFSIGPYNPASGMPLPRWPGQPAGFEQAWMGYYMAMEQLSSHMLSLFARALDLSPAWFEDKIDKHRCSLRALNYPEQDTPPAPGQIRAGAHTDYGSLTLLRADFHVPGGLQVKGKDGEWHNAPQVPDSYVVNIGDLMARWTNDRWVSTLHRVVNPPLEASQLEAGATRRQSMAFFHNINADTVVECIPTCAGEEGPKYAPITAFDHLMQKHLASMGC
jgi:isopenicillin N synthase-like dioxygenase